MSIVYDISVFEISTFNWIHICTESIIYMYIYDKEVKGILKNCILQYLINSVVCTRNCRNSVKRILSMGNTFYTLCNNVICHLYLWDTIFSLLIWHLLVLETNQTVDSVSLWILIHKYWSNIYTLRVVHWREWLSNRAYRCKKYLDKIYCKIPLWVILKSWLLKSCQYVQLLND